MRVVQHVLVLDDGAGVDREGTLVAKRCSAASGTVHVGVMRELHRRQNAGRKARDSKRSARVANAVPIRSAVNGNVVDSETGVVDQTRTDRPGIAADRVPCRGTVVSGVW